MPKVTPEHVEARRVQILSAAGVCFAQKGFQKTTIKDICARAGLSTGAVYTYFGSKDDIIKALADENVRQNEEEFEKLRKCRTFEEALREFMDILTYLKECNKVASKAGLDMYKMKVSLWAECIRNPEAMGVKDTYGLVVRELAKLIRRAQRKGEVAAGLDGKAAAQTLVSLLEGFTLQQAIDGSLSTERYLANAMALLTGGMLGKKGTRRKKR